MLSRKQNNIFYFGSWLLSHGVLIRLDSGRGSSSLYKYKYFLCSFFKSLSRTSAPIRAWNCNFPPLLGNYDKPTNHSTDRPTARRIDQVRKVSLQIIISGFRILLMRGLNSELHEQGWTYRLHPTHTNKGTQVELLFNNVQRSIKQNCSLCRHQFLHLSNHPFIYLTIYLSA